MSRPHPVSGYELADRYRTDDGRVYLSGSQALARLPLEQLRADRRAGLNTAAYLSGYPGSPLAGYDRDVAVAVRQAEADGYAYVYQPGLNEELAATAVMGTQLASTVQSARYDGVIGVWYGKAPGLDRASDAIRHGVFSGSSPHGGVVAIVGDDPAAMSSTLPSSSEASLVHLRMPVLYPGDVQEALDLGRHAIALSRASGLWSGMKIVESVADGTGTVELAHDRITPIVPTMEVDGALFVPHPSRRLLTPHTRGMETEIVEVRLDLARRYGADNRLNRVSVRSGSDWLGIVAAGHSYFDLVEALRLLGLADESDLRDAGIRLLKLGMPSPLDPATVREFADGLAEIVVIEEKAALVELTIKDVLYPAAVRPAVVGKRDEDDRVLFPASGSLDPDAIAAGLRGRLTRRLSPDRLAPPPAEQRRRIPLSIERTPYFCSGCPHNISTKTADGVLVGGGIGCHSMLLLMEPERVGDIVGSTAMGNEGAQWFGMAPFVGEHHLVQNLGDGTLFHSGMLAVRAAVANGANITYKVLYNGAVAMTGGQDPFGQIDVPGLVDVLLAEGVARVLITTDDLDRYRHISLPSGVDVWDRERVVEAQEVLARVPGTTVLIHDQRCAAEKRRDRKRGKIETPKFRVIINERVCEGCGDCGDVSNCLSVQPVETPFGRKTHIDQASCNLDLSCVRGDCPSFATVVPSPRRARRAARHAASSTDTATGSVAVATRPVPRVPTDIALPSLAVDPTDCTVRLSGIGGTGVVTVSQLIGTAALLDGLQVRGLDQTGLSQKAGPVVSDVRLTTEAPRAANKATRGSVDVLLAIDMLVAASDAHLAGASAERTTLVGSTSVTPTGSMIVHPDQQYPAAEAAARLLAATRPHPRLVDGLRLTDALVGDAATANVFMLGVAFQAGLLPISLDSITRAIELNGVAVTKNLAAFTWGRQWVVDPAGTDPEADAPSASAVALVELLATDLVGYQSQAYAQQFRDLVTIAAAAEARATGRPVDLESPDPGMYTAAVARNLHKLMAYKDEYEVARLLLAPEARAAAEEVAGPGARVRWQLHPPILRALGMRRKIELGRWARPVMRLLRAMRRVRGTPFDVFGWASLRRLERRMAREYAAAIRTVSERLDASNLDDAVTLAALPDSVRGYEHIKRRRAVAYRDELALRVKEFGG